jgi:hypothetical protein
MCAIVGGADPLKTFELFATPALHADALRGYGDTNLPTTIRIVK